MCTRTLHIRARTQRTHMRWLPPTLGLSCTSSIAAQKGIDNGMLRFDYRNSIYREALLRMSECPRVLSLSETKPNISSEYKHNIWTILLILQQCMMW